MAWHGTEWNEILRFSFRCLFFLFLPFSLYHFGGSFFSFLFVSSHFFFVLFGFSLAFNVPLFLLFFFFLLFVLYTLDTLL